MKSLFEQETSNEILKRVQDLPVNAARQWGKMNSAQMLAHCGNALEMASGKINPKRVFIGRILGPLFKSQYSNEAPFGKSSPTSKELQVSDEKDFEKEKERLKSLIKNFTDAGETGVTNKPHPFFGSLSSTEWGKGMYKHLDHHLRQFGG